MDARHALRPSGNGRPAVTASNLLERLDLERPDFPERPNPRKGPATDSKRRADLGQFFTPIGVARFMASMLQVREPPAALRILDPGGGSGVLTAAVVAELCGRPECSRPAALQATVWELDARLAGDLDRTFEHCRAVCAKAGVAFRGEHRRGNFVLDAAVRADDQDLLEPERHPRFHVAIMNPPYRKLRSDSAERSRLSTAGIETSNLYSAFVWLALKLLAGGGELVAITPRSFMNGSYFRPFRQALSRELAFRRIHVYDARDAAFADDGVLQENAIFHGVRGASPEAIRITTSLGPADDGLLERTVEPDELILPHDPERVLHVVPDETDARIAAHMRRLPHTLAGLGVSVSTGRVVGFRAKERLRADAGPGDAPLILPGHCAPGFVAWPRASGTKANALAVTGPDDDLLLPAGWYVLVNRFSAKEDRRRVVAALYDPARIDADHVAFDNKLNVLHRRNAGLPEHLAKGLAVFLNSTAVDAYFRQFSGHTQVNAGDLRSLRFPSAGVLDRLGRRVDGNLPVQEQINRVVRQEVFEMDEGDDPIVVKEKVDAAKAVLKALKAPKAQRDRRSPFSGCWTSAPRPPGATRAHRCAASPSSWTGWHRATGRTMPPTRGRPSGASPCTSSCRWGSFSSTRTTRHVRPTARRTSTGSSPAPSRFSGVTERTNGMGRFQRTSHPLRGTTGSRSRRAPCSAFRRGRRRLRRERPAGRDAAIRYATERIRRHRPPPCRRPGEARRALTAGAAPPRRRAGPPVTGAISAPRPARSRGCRRARAASGRRACRARAP